MQHLVIGYHGTDHQHVDVIESKGFAPSGLVSWLGPGIYFWEQDHQQALWWATEKKKFITPAVLSAQIDLTDLCLDLTTGEGQSLYRELLEKIFERDKIRSEFRKFVDAHPNYPDAFCLHWICKLFKFDSIRALVMQGDRKYNLPVPRFRNRFSTTPSRIVVKTSLVIAILNPDKIKKRSRLEQVEP